MNSPSVRRNSSLRSFLQSIKSPVVRKREEARFSQIIDRERARLRVANPAATEDEIESMIERIMARATQTTSVSSAPPFIPAHIRDRDKQGHDDWLRQTRHLRQG